MGDGKKLNINYKADDNSFHFHHKCDEQPNPTDFQLHYEIGYEIFMFISGAGSYNIEGSTYQLEPYSVLIMNSNELHVVNISKHSPYERLVLTINENFLPPFMLNGVDLFQKMKFRKLGQDNKIKAETVISSGLLELITKLYQLLEKKSPENEIVAKCVIVQILSTINNIAETDFPRTNRKANHKVIGVLEYINSHLDETLTLDSLSEKFFLTKYHLCHTFKDATGYSIHQYIAYKRIRLADRLMLEGYTPTQACFMTGFNCYSNFYKSYRKLTGKSPRSRKLK
jgi:AraC-like DNA-binding protein/mannose-6-phosphate isomerase-like protein (cupin superfamily)